MNRHAGGEVVIFTSRLRHEVELVGGALRDGQVPFREEPLAEPGTPELTARPSQTVNAWWRLLVPGQFEPHARSIVATLPVSEPSVSGPGVSAKQLRSGELALLLLVVLTLVATA